MTTAPAATTAAAITLAHYLTAAALAPTLDRDSKRDGGLRTYLAQVWQGGRCADCGQASDSLEFAHFTRSRGVYAAGLGAMTCRECNLIHTHVADDDGSLPWSYVAGMAILPPATLPSRPVLTALHRDAQSAAHAARVAEAARRMAERG